MSFAQLILGEGISLTNMDDTEQLAYRHLKKLGYTKILFEPLGKSSPPDFSIDGRIAVEVRRLNKSISFKDSYRGLEEDRLPLQEIAEKVTRNFDGMYSGESYFVGIRIISQPTNYRRIKSELKQVLQTFIDEGSPCGPATNFPLAEGAVHISFRKSSPQMNRVFIVGSINDRRNSGWIYEDLKSNIGLYCSEKLRKIARVRPLFEEVWLVLVNRLVPVLEVEVLTDIQQKIDFASGWDKVILVNLFDEANWVCISGQ